VDFSTALIAAKLGHKITRPGWVPGTFVVMQDGYPEGIGINANTARATGIPEGTVCRFQPYLISLTAAGDFVPWVIGHSDVLADDWAFEAVPQ
jgi:hypothetical protein